MSAILLAASLLGSVYLSPSDAGAPTVQPAAVTAPAADAEKKICKTEAVTGTRFTKRVCRTQAQIDEERRAAREMLDELPRRCGGECGGD